MPGIIFGRAAQGLYLHFTLDPGHSHTHRPFAALGVYIQTKVVCVCERNKKKSGATLGERHVTFHYERVRKIEHPHLQHPARETHLLEYPRDFCNSI